MKSMILKIDEGRIPNVGEVATWAVQLTEYLRTKNICDAPHGVQNCDAALHHLHTMTFDAPELNMSNYNEEDVSELNEAMKDVHAYLDNFLST